MHRARVFRKLEDFTLSIEWLTSVTTQTQTLLRVVNVGNRQIYKGDDRLFFHLYFHDTPYTESFSFVLRVDYLDARGILKIPVVLREAKGKLVKNKTREFLLFDYCQLEVNPVTCTLTCLYVSLENNKIAFSDDDCDPQIEPVLPFVFEAPEGVHSESMHYLPLHPDDELLVGERVADQAQRTPIWYNDLSAAPALAGAHPEGFLGIPPTTALAVVGDTPITLRAAQGGAGGAWGAKEISGSSFGKYACGYWVAEDSGGNGPLPPTSTADVLRKQSNMRFGRIYEDIAKLITMHNFPDWHYYECGRIAFKDSNSCSHEDCHEEFPCARRGGRFGDFWVTHEYSSSPDGLAIVPNQTWNTFPAVTRHEYQDSDVDPKKCALEYKMSYMSSKFPDYYIPQLYAEMIALGAAMAVLIRCKRRRQTVDGVVRVVHEAFAYRIFRDPQIEQEILDNVAFSQTAPADVKLGDWIAQHKGRYESLARKLSDIAQKTPAIPLKIPEKLLQEYQERRKKLLLKVRGSGNNVAF